MNGIKIWFLAVRPWSFSASVIPVLLGLALVVYNGHKVNWLTFIITLIGVVCFHTAANLRNDCFDHKRGLDTEVYPMSGAIVRGLLTESRIFRAAMLFAAIGSACGLFLIHTCGWMILAFGVFGALLALGYTGPGFCLKYAGLGDMAIFIAFGILPVFGTYWVQVQTFSWLPVLWSIPIASCTVGILHANNWRDVTRDSARNCRTLAGLLGERGCRLYYGMLVLGPIVLVVAYVVLARLLHNPDFAPLTVLLVIFALPVGFNLTGINRDSNPGVFVMLDGKTAQMGIVFGLLLTMAFFAGRFLERFT